MYYSVIEQTNSVERKVISIPKPIFQGNKGCSKCSRGTPKQYDSHMLSGGAVGYSKCTWQCV